MALGIIGILGKSKEKDTLDLMKKHIEKIVETKDAYKEAYTLFKANKKKKAEMMANTVSEKEHDADLICKRIVVNLYEGAFMPNMRSNIYRTVEEIDTVADKIKNAANMIPFLKVVKLNNVLKDILDEFHDPKPAATTIATLIKRMIDKGLSAIINMVATESIIHWSRKQIIFHCK